MAFWDRFRQWFSGESTDAAKPAETAPAAAGGASPLDLETEDVVDLDIELDDSVPELLLDDDEPGSLDSIDGLGRSRHLELPDLIDDDEVTELGVDHEALRRRMRRKDPLFPDDEITEVTWLDRVNTDEELTDFGSGLLDGVALEPDTPSDDLLEPPRLDEVPSASLDALDETRFVREDVPGENTVPLPVDDVELEPTALLIADETNTGPAPTLVTPVYEESVDSAVESQGEVTDFHLDMLAWDEDENTDGEALAPAPQAAPRTGPRFKNSLQIADAVVLRALRAEHYPDCDDASDETLHRLARCDAGLLKASAELGERFEEIVVLAEDDALLDSAMLYAGVRTAPRIRGARQELRVMAGAIQMRRLGWAAAGRARTVVDVVGDASGGLAATLERFELLLDARRHVLESAPVEFSDRVEAEPVEAVGLHRLDGFAWSD